MYNSNVSISISDDSSDELAGKLKPRVRRKRRKLGLRGKTQFSREVIINRIVKLWPLLVFIPFAALLVFEAYRLGGKPNPLGKPSESVPRNKPVQHIDKKPPANLNRLDPLTRVVRGVRERKHLLLKIFVLNSLLYTIIIITIVILVIITSLHGRRTFPDQ